MRLFLAIVAEAVNPTTKSGKEFKRNTEALLQKNREFMNGAKEYRKNVLDVYGMCQERGISCSWD